MTNSERVKYFYETIVSCHMLEELHVFISADCVVKIGKDSVPVGVDGMKRHLQDIRETYPDCKINVIRQFVDDDYVVSEFIMTGTHAGVFLGITPTYKVISISGVNIDRVIDGKIVEHGGAANTFDAFWENSLIKPV